MPNYLTSRLEGENTISVEYGGEIVVLYGTDMLEAMTILSREDGSERVVQTRALFKMVCAAPNANWLSGLVEVDDKGSLYSRLRSQKRCPQKD